MKRWGQDRRALAAAAVLAVGPMVPAIAIGSGYPTNLKKHVYESSISVVKPTGDHGGTISFEAKTNGGGQVVSIFGLDIENIPLKCTNGTARVGSESLASIEVSAHVSHSGSFSYKENLTAAGFSGVGVKVQGRLLDRGKKIKGTQTVSVSPSPASLFSGDKQYTGCVGSKTSHRRSANLHWARLVL